MSDIYIYRLPLRAVGRLDNKSQAFLDKVGHQDLRSLLILHQNVVRGGDLVSFEAIQQRDTDHSGWREKADSYAYIDIPLLMTCNHVFNVLCFCLQGCVLQHRQATFEAADTAHGGKHRRLHFNVPHSSLVRFPQILQLFFVREGAERSIQAPLACRDPEFGTSGRASVIKT